jgi:hypothetical protein
MRPGRASVLPGSCECLHSAFVGMKVFCFRRSLDFALSNSSSPHLVSNQQKSVSNASEKIGRTSMRKCSIRFGSLAAAVRCRICDAGNRAQFASSVISYNAGTGRASGYNQPTTQRSGMPSTFTNDPNFPSPVDPYDPPYLAEQIVSIGAGGSLTVQLRRVNSQRCRESVRRRFYCLWQRRIYSAISTREKPTELYLARTPGSTRVSVSADNRDVLHIGYESGADFDSYFPTDGAGTFRKAGRILALANAASFNGMTLDQIRAQYAGSAGGTGFDLGGLAMRAEIQSRSIRSISCAWRC